MFILILLISIVLSQDVLAKDIVVLAPGTYEVSKYESNEIPLRHAFESNIKIRKFYLNCTSECSEMQLEHKFNIVWKKIIKIDPEYLIIRGNLLWDRFANRIRLYSKTHKVGIFNFYGDQNIINQIDKDTNIFFSIERINIKPILQYFAYNAKEFNNYYIFRDEDFYNLIKSIDLKKQLKSYDSSYKIKIIQVNNLADLKYSLALIQYKEQGVIITFIKELKSGSKFLDINTISKNVSLNNSKHILVSLDLDVSKYYHVSLISKLYNQEYPYTWFNKCDAANFSKYKAQKQYFFYPNRLLILNSTEILKLYNGYQFLKHTSNSVDIFR